MSQHLFKTPEGQNNNIKYKSTFFFLLQNVNMKIDSIEIFPVADLPISGGNARFKPLAFFDESL